MNLDIKMAIIPIGEKWDESIKKRFDEKLKKLPKRIRIYKKEPIINEVDILEESEKLSLLEPDVLLLVALHGGSARAMVFAATRINVPTIIWCHNKYHSLASSSLTKQALCQLGKKCHLIIGDDKKAYRKLLTAAVAGGTVKVLSKSRIGQLGPIHFNLIGTEVNPLNVMKQYGSWIVPIYISELKRKVNEINLDNVEEFILKIRDWCQVNVEDNILRKAVKIHLALKEISQEKKLSIIALDCWNELMPEFLVSPCIGFVEDSYRIACERDIALAVLSIVGNSIHGKVGYTGDLYSFNEETGIATFMHCGSYRELHSLKNKMEIVSKPPLFISSREGEIISCHPILKNGIGTIVILHGIEINRLHIKRCEILNTDFSEHMKVTVRILDDANLFLKEISGNHYTIFQGDYFDYWKLWAEWSNVKIN